MNSKKTRSASRLLDPNMPQMDVNERFVEGCATGDFQTVNNILEAIKDFNIDVTDNLGRTALRLAVANEHIEVVQALLNRSDSQKLREALLLAIFMGHTQIAETILRHPQYKIFNDKKFLNGATDSFWQTPSSDDAQFSPDITPIMLAAQYNRTEIVQMLLLNGDRIEKPHDFHCKCNECSNRFKFDSLRHAQSRLNAYRGLSSESYISLASIDPILTAFEMGHELRILSEKEKYFKSEYLELAENLSEYATKLLSNVRGRDELEIVLNKDGKESEEKYERLARLDLALRYQEMPFVAHPNCQQKLVEIWYTGIRKITKMNKMLVILLFLGFVFFIPFGSFIFMIAPKSKLGRFMSLPCIKFISFTVSYLTFILMIIASSLKIEDQDKHRTRFSSTYKSLVDNFTRYVENEELPIRFEVPDFCFRPSDPNDLDIIMCIWLLGLVAREVKEVFVYGIKNFLYSWSNILTTAMNILFIGSYGLKYYTLIKVRIEKERINDPGFWSMVENLEKNDLLSQESVFQTFYWLNADRFYWVSLDPINLSEALFAISIIFSFCRLCFWLPANQNLGPLQITLGQMISDILKFICIFTIVFTGFLFGLNNLYWYYDGNVRGSVEISSHINLASTDPKTKAEQRFGTIGATCLTMFFALYTLGESDDVQIEPFENKLTPNFGYILFGMFHITNITILMSMLIAMMTKSFESILEESDTEWKFSRSRLYMEFIKEGSVLPIPFNLIPTPALATDIFKKIFSCFKNKSSEPPSNDDLPSSKPNGIANGKLPKSIEATAQQTHHNKPQKRHSIGGDVLTYRKVMERVARRFLLHNQREDEDVKESDFDELKQDVQMARFDMLNDLKSARYNLLKYTNVLHNGLALLGEYFLQKDFTSEISKKFKSFKSIESNLQNELIEYDVYSSTLNSKNLTKKN